MKRLLHLTLALVAALAVALTPTAAHADTPTGKLVLVLDSSGSMKEPAGDGHSKIANAKAALTDVVDSLDPNARVGMRVYGATVFDKSQPGACTDSQLTVPIGPAGNKRALKAAIAKYKPYGETPIAYALGEAGKDLGKSGQRTIVLVSDGEETCGEDPCKIAKDLTNQGIDLRIDVIGLDVSGKAKEQLKCVAANGKGKYSDADNLTDLKKQLSTAKERALHPFQVTGTPVQGTQDQQSAPTISNGRWTDTLPTKHEQLKLYRLKRTMPGSTLWVGASSELKVAGARGEGVDLKLTTEGGESCGWSIAYAVGGSEATTGLMFGLAGSRNPGARQECTSGDLIFSIVLHSNNKTDLGGTPVQLDVYEEPPVSDVASLPAGTGRVNWQQMPMGPSTKIKGGTTFANAPKLASKKTYAFDIAAGETQVFAVDADWGQQIQAFLNAGTVRSGGSVLQTARVDLIGPYGGDAHSAWAQNMTAGPNLVPSTGAKAAVTTPVIRYRNTDSGADSAPKAAALPGTYYLVLSYPKRSGTKMPVIPVIMQAAVLGTAGDGAPTYVRDGSAVSPSATPPTDSSPAASSSRSATPIVEPSDNSIDQSQGRPWGLIAGLAAGGLLLGAVGVVAVRQLRKR